MSFEKGHKRRPTSIATSVIFGERSLDRTFTNEIDKAYITSDGQILQSSMVKSGSPSKRQLTGSTSQVRFSLPPQSDDSFTDEDSFSFNDNSFEKKVIFNTESKQLLDPLESRGRTTEKVGDSLRALLSRSPDRYKLHIRPESKISEHLIPIPVELQLPPTLSPKAKSKRRPASLVFNGNFYEPLDKSFLSTVSKQKSYRQSKSLPSSPLPKSTQTTSKKVVIPDLSKSALFGIAQRKPQELDNEQEILNPSQAALKQNNQLNQKFSFPSLSSKAVATEKQNTSINGKGKLLPSSNDKSNSEYNGQNSSKGIKEASPSKGLAIFSENGDLHRPIREGFGHFVPIGDSILQPTQNSIKFHRHKRSQSQIIDFPAEEFDSVKTQSGLKDSDCHQTSSQQPDFSSLSIPPLYPTTDIIEDNSQDSIQTSENFDAEPEEISLQNKNTSVHNEGIEQEDEDEDEETSYDETTQLIDLGNLIISSANGHQFTENDFADLEKDINSSSRSYSVAKFSNSPKVHPSIDDISIEEIIIEKTADDQSLKLLMVPENLSKPLVPLGPYLQQEKVYPSDIVEGDLIRDNNHAKFLLQKQRESPLLSQSSYESQLSEPFSNTSSVQTQASSYIATPALTVDLTNDEYDVTFVKNNFNRVDSFRSIVKRLSNGDLRETIVLDDEIDCRPSSKLNHDKAKSVSDIVEGEESGRCFSSFSFETIASEVQLHHTSYHDVRVSQNRKSWSHSPRMYTKENKSVIELCDDTMHRSVNIMDELRRQKTILLKKQQELLKQQKEERDKLTRIQDLQKQLQKNKSQASLSSLSTTPSSVRTASSQYYDYANSQSYNFQTFMNEN
ncbi:hypothetical protein WICMUC_001956 [Wickerhamomyces mucosus]|uniref:Uncharacterized protein n=1 Tax=Wickerhamomyces mucosus TaxID=1378264 RepID=A0A9P8PSW3_9ASCO|nr:hypothetical protein WICMUC_001956 [Wickerhamomyces mucosus]